MSDSSFFFTAQLSRQELSVAAFELPYLSYEEAAGHHIKSAIADRWGIDSNDFHIEHYVLWWDHLGDDELVSEEGRGNNKTTRILVKFKNSVTRPFNTVAEAEERAERMKEEGRLKSKVEDETAVNAKKEEAVKELKPPVERTFTLGGGADNTTSTTIGSLVESLFPNTTEQYSEVVTSVRGKVVVSYTKSHAVYPFVFRTGGKDMRTMWAAELRARLAGSVHPAALGGPEVYQSAIQALEDEGSTSTATPAWNMTVSISCRPQ